MESQELIDAFRKELNLVEEQGGQQVGVASIRSYLDALEKDAVVSQEFRKLEHEGVLAHYVAMNQHGIELFKAVLEAGKSALQTLLIINGGAVVALLGVMSNLAGKLGGDTLARYLALPLLQFGIGVLAGALGFAFRYFSQACYAESTPQQKIINTNASKNKFQKWGDSFRYLAILSALFGYILFGFALVNAYHAVIWSFPT